MCDATSVPLRHFIARKREHNKSSPRIAFDAPCGGDESVRHMAGARFAEIRVRACIRAELRPNLEKLGIRTGPISIG